MEKILRMFDGEYWWGLSTRYGIKFPLSAKSVFSLDGRINDTYNQLNFCLISTAGRYIYSDGGFSLSVDQGSMRLNGDKEIVIEQNRKNLADAYYAVASKYFPSNGKAPNALSYTNPQYCTWVELLENQNQKGILEYAKSIIDVGMPAGEMIIDDFWFESYGDYQFHSGRFPHPKQMVDQLHEMGFAVVMWVCPFITADTRTCIDLENKGFLLKDKTGRTAIRNWWNGYSAVLDLTNPSAVDWFISQLDGLVAKYEIDGFKFDAGDAFYYKEDDNFFYPGKPNDQSIIWAKMSEKYAFNELRSTVGCGGRGITQRLNDKRHSWTDENGIGNIIPAALNASLIGYPFVCPDMIGGGLNGDFCGGTALDSELMARWCACVALLPMMQFSYSLWKKDDALRQTAKECALLHFGLKDYLISCVRNYFETNRPIVVPLGFDYPNEGVDDVADEFLLGKDYLVAPVITKGATGRNVVLPSGKWKQMPDGKVYGKGVYFIESAVGNIIYFIKN